MLAPELPLKARILTLGCQVNYADSLRYTELFARHGIGLTENLSEADFCLVNTCTVTLKANRKSRHMIHQAKRVNPNLKLILAGCYTAVSPDEVRELVPSDLLLPRAAAFAELDAWLGGLHLENKGELPQDLSPMNGRTRRFLKIQDGCDSYCTFCIIPRARGGETSRPVVEILAEVERAVSVGFREFTLSGVCLGRYGRDRHPDNRQLRQLLEAMGGIQGVERIRFGSIDGHDLGVDFIEWLAHFSPFCRHLHIPLQSGSDRILKNMRRHYDRRQFLEKMEVLHQNFPSASFATDVIVGFPGETDADFSATVSAIREAGFCRLHVFPFSRRPMTPAAAYPDPVPESLKFERCRELNELDGGLREGYYRSRIGAIDTVLFEDQFEGVASGHTGDYCPVQLLAQEGETVINRLGRVRLADVAEGRLVGELVEWL